MLSLSARIVARFHFIFLALSVAIVVVVVVEAFSTALCSWLQSNLLLSLCRRALIGLAAAAAAVAFSDAFADALSPAGLSFVCALPKFYDHPNVMMLLMMLLFNPQFPPSPSLSLYFLLAHLATPTAHTARPDNNVV